MRKLNLWLAAALLVFAAACSKDEVVINSSGDQAWKMLASTGANVAVISQPSGDVVKNNFAQASGTITKMATFGGRIYLLAKDDYKITVVDEVSGEQLAVLDFSASQLMPSAIAFANATDAYVAHENSDKISLVDIYYNKVVRQINVGNNPTDLAYLASGYIAVTNSGSNSVSIINTKTYAKERDVATNPVPAYVGATDSKKIFTIVCRGNGKDGSGEKTSGYVQFLNPATGEITYTKEIKNLGIDGSEITPRSLAINEKGLTFIATNYAMYKLNTKLKSPVLSVVKRDDFAGVSYNYALQEIIVIKSDGTAYAADNTTALKTYDLVLPGTFGAVLSLK